MQKANLTALIIFLSVVAQAQDIDSLKRRILLLETNQQNIQINLAKAHKKYSSGIGMVIVGALFSIAAPNFSSTAKVPVYVVGGGLLIAGSIITIDSHHFIGLAGSKK